MNNRQFREHIADLLERQRREAEAAAQVTAPRKPPVSVKVKKAAKKKRSA